MFNDIFLDYLLENNLLTEEDALKVKEYATNNNCLVVDTISQNGLIKEEMLYESLASFLGLPLKDLQLFELKLETIDKFPREQLIINKTIPFNETDKEVSFALANPLVIEDIIELKQYVNKRFNFVIVVPSKLEELMAFLSNKIKQQDLIENYADETLDVTSGNDPDRDDVNAPIIELCNSIINEAVTRKASDIHIEPFENVVYVRYRIDGKLLLITKIKPHLLQPLVARFKIMAEMNIAERRIPQDGKISQEINGMNYDFRVSTMPTIHGEKLVIRIYNKTLNSRNLAVLGLDDAQKELVINMITRPHGIILLTGPTGSGKSTSLYAFLRYLNNEATNITTIEDPVENQIEGINQVQINSKANLTFATVLRAVLRQDPNIIMIGEIRDEETAQIATRAAITGHLVFSTLHTNSAAGVVSRLIDMKVPPYLVADSLLCSISQRLVRKLCPKCKKEHMTSPGEMEILGLEEPKKIYEPVGCPYCSNTGYSGRQGIFEILPIDTKIRNIVMSKDYTSEKLTNAVKGTISTVIDNARLKVLSGETSINEYEDLIEEVGSQERLDSMSGY